MAYLLKSQTIGAAGELNQFPTSNSIWIIENVDPWVGGPVEFHREYRLKHVATGQYLGVVEREENGRIEFDWKMSIKRDDSDNLFVFLPIDQQVQSCVLPSQSFFVIQHRNSALFIHFHSIEPAASPRQIGTRPLFTLRLPTPPGMDVIIVY